MFTWTVIDTASIEKGRPKTTSYALGYCTQNTDNIEIDLILIFNWQTRGQKTKRTRRVPGAGLTSCQRNSAIRHSMKPSTAPNRCNYPQGYGKGVTILNNEGPTMEEEV